MILVFDRRTSIVAIGCWMTSEPIHSSVPLPAANNREYVFVPMLTDQAAAIMAFRLDHA
jgi:hypothetical protein